MDLRRILFIAEGQLGDLLLLTPALRSVRDTYPNASISVLVLERHAASGQFSRTFHNLALLPGERPGCVLSTNPTITDLIVVDRKALRGLKGLARMKTELSIVRLIRRKRFDVVICTFPEDRFTLWAFASGARVRVGQGGQSFSFLLSHAPDIRKDQHGVLEYYCDLVRQIGAGITSLRTEYSIPDGSKVWVDEYLRSVDESPTQRFVAVHPGASGDYKIWPPERYAALIDFIQENLGARVILLRGSQDEAVVAAIRQALRSMPIIADTGSNVEHCAALLKRCALCISNDSGPRHLAVAVGTPSLAFFRQHHDHEWKIYDDSSVCVTLKGELLCPVCPRGKCLDRIPQNVRFGSYCTRMISVDDAITRVSEMLRPSGSPP